MLFYIIIIHLATKIIHFTDNRVWTSESADLQCWLGEKKIYIWTDNLSVDLCQDPA